MQAVVGPGQIARRVAPLRRSGNDLLAGKGEASPEKLVRLGRKLGQAAGGVGRLRSGLSAAAAGAGLLASRFGAGGRRGAARSRAASNAPPRAPAGRSKPSGASTKARGSWPKASAGPPSASRSVRDELGDLLPVLRSGGLARARRLRTALEQAAASDPSLAAEVREAERLVEALALARNQAKRAHANATRLHAGQVSLAEGEREAPQRRRAAGARRRSPFPPAWLGSAPAPPSWSAASPSSAAAPSALQQPPRRGLSRLPPAAGRPHPRRGAGSPPRPRACTARSGTCAAPRRGSSTRATSSSPPWRGRRRPERERAGQVIDLRHGGQAAQMLVIPRYTFNTPGSEALNGRLKSDAASLADSSGLRPASPAAPPSSPTTATRSPRGSRWWSLAITLVTFLVLVLVLRALPLAAIAVGAEPAHRRRRLRRPDPALRRPRRLAAGRPHLRRRDRRRGDLRDRLRPLDRLRGLPADADAREPRGGRRPTRRRSPSAWSAPRG